MTPFRTDNSNFSKYVAILAAYFFCTTAVAQDVTFRSDDAGVAVTGRYVGFDGARVTVATTSGPVTFRSSDMVCDGDTCPDFSNFVPAVRVAADPRIAALLVPPLLDAFARDRGWSVDVAVGKILLSDGDGHMRLDVTLGAQEFSEGFDQFLNHEVDVFVTTRLLLPDEVGQAQASGLGQLNDASQTRIIALDGLVPVASPFSGRTTISLPELVEIFTGQSETMAPIMSNDISGLLNGFEVETLSLSQTRLSVPGQDQSLQRVLDTVIDTDNHIALVPFGQTGMAQPLGLAGPCGLVARASFIGLKTEDYPLTYPIVVYLPQRQLHDSVVDLLDWLRSPSAQLVIRRAGFADLTAAPIPLVGQGDRLANAIQSAGPEISLSELQRLISVLQPRVRMSTTFRFEPGSTQLDGPSQSNVMQLAQAIRDGRFGGRELLLIGFSDGQGSADANLGLSRARAQAVETELERALGQTLPGNVVVSTEAFGEALPMACDDTIWGQQTNRRVELWVSDLD